MSMNETPEYGESGFIPTVENVRDAGDRRVYETIDGREETDLIGEPGEPLKRRADLISDEQQEHLAQEERL